jgi:hypothetical protein
LVGPGRSATVNGERLEAAVAALASMTPNGAAISATNPAQVALLPGEYHVTKSGSDPGITLDTNYTGIVGLGPPGSVRITSARPGLNEETGAIIKQTAHTVYLESFTIHAYATQDGLSYFKSGCLEIGNETIVDGLTGCTTVGSLLTKFTGTPFADVQVGDIVEVSNGAGLTRRQCYRVAGVGGNQVLWLVRSPGDSSGDVTVTVRRANAGSVYRDLLATHDAFSVGTYSSIFSLGSIAGTWLDCRTGWGGWRVATYQSLLAYMERCYGDQGSYGGDGGVHSLSADPTLYCVIDGTFIDCLGEDYCWGGCGSFGGHIGSLAYFLRCRAKDNSFAIGRRCEGTFIDTGGGANCFGGTADNPGSPAQYGQFVGTHVNGWATGRSWGSGHAIAVNSGTMRNCRLTAMPDAMYMTGAKIEQCRLAVTGSNKHCVVLNDNNSVLLFDTLVANGSGASIYSATAKTVMAHGCAMNTMPGDDVTLASGYTPTNANTISSAIS